MHRLHVVTGTCRHHFGCLHYLNPRQQAHIWSASCLCFNVLWHTFHCQGGIQVISSPRDAVWFDFEKYQFKYWWIKQIQLAGRASSEGEIGSGPGSGLCARFTNPWHSALPQFASLPREELGNMANLSLNSKSLIRAWIRYNDFTQWEPNRHALHNIFLTGEVETTSKIGPGWSNWNVHGVSNPWIL